MVEGYSLGVDLGTTYTAAALSRSRSVELCTLGDRAPVVPSVVFLVEDGSVLVGDAATRRATLEPTRAAREFKRRLGDPVPILLGGSPMSPETLTARLLQWVVREVSTREGGPPAKLVVTCPANWGPHRRELLQHAIEMADVGPAEVVTEPVAAAVDAASTERWEDGALLAVYDLGGGTFDAAVLRKQPDGFELLGRPEGIEHLGGADFDEAVFRHVLSVLGDEALQSKDNSPEVLAAVARLRQDCVEAKEALSADTVTAIVVTLPGVSQTVRLTRAEFEDMIRPAIGDTLACMQRALASAGVGPQDLASVILVGGSSRIPLVAQMLGTELGRPIAVASHPKSSVALGAARIGGALDAEPLVAPAPPTPGDEAGRGVPGPPTPVKPGGTPPRATVRRVAVVAAGVVAVLVLGALAVVRPWADKRAGGSPPPATNTPSVATTSATPTTATPTTATPTIATPTTPPGGILPRAAAPLPDDVVLGSRQVGQTESLVSVSIGNGRVTPFPRLADSQGQDGRPVLSADRLTMLFLDLAPQTTGGNKRLMVAGSDGTGARPLFPSGVPDCPNPVRPAWHSQTGTFVLQCDLKGGRRELRLLQAGATTARRLDAGFLGDPGFSPDASKVVYWKNTRQSGQGALYVLDLRSPGSKPVRLTSGPRDGDPAFSPDGRTVAFSRYGGGATNFDIDTVAATGGTPTRLVATSALESDPAWSPDGNRIAYSCDPDGTGPKARALCTVDLATQARRRVTAQEVLTPVWTQR